MKISKEEVMSFKKENLTQEQKNEIRKYVELRKKSGDDFNYAFARHYNIEKGDYEALLISNWKDTHLDRYYTGEPTDFSDYIRRGILEEKARIKKNKEEARREKELNFDRYFKDFVNPFDSGDVNDMEEDLISKTNDSFEIYCIQRAASRAQKVIKIRALQQLKEYEEATQKETAQTEEKGIRVVGQIYDNDDDPTLILSDGRHVLSSEYYKKK